MQYASKFGKLSSGHRTGKGQFSFQTQRKAGSAKECSNYHTTALISHPNSNAQNSPSQASTVGELPDVQVGFRKGRGSSDQIPNICLIIKKAREFPEKHLLLFY